MIPFDGSAQTGGKEPFGVLIPMADNSLIGRSMGPRAKTHIYRWRPGRGAETLKTLDAYTLDLTASRDGTHLYAVYVAGATQGAPKGCGAIHEIQPDGRATSLYDYDPAGTMGCLPYFIRQGSGSSLYVTTLGGGEHDDGTLLRLAPDGQAALLHVYERDSGVTPAYPPTVADDGTVYLLGKRGIFRLGADGQANLVAALDASVGRDPSELIIGSDGALFGTTAEGGPNNGGTIFRFDPAGDRLTVLHAMGGQDLGRRGGTRPALGADGMIYGQCIWGGNGYGTIWRIAQDGSGFEMLFAPDLDVTGSTWTTIGSYPFASMADGQLVGSMRWAGEHGDGTLYALRTRPSAGSAGGQAR